VHLDDTCTTVTLEQTKRGMYFLYVSGEGGVPLYTSPRTRERPPLPHVTAALDKAWSEGCELDVGGTCWVAISRITSTLEERLAFAVAPVARRLASVAPLCSPAAGPTSLLPFLTSPYDPTKDVLYSRIGYYLMRKTGTTTFGCPPTCASACCVGNGPPMRHARRMVEVKGLFAAFLAAARR
jgi:hypothetical protein